MKETEAQEIEREQAFLTQVVPLVESDSEEETPQRPTKSTADSESDSESENEYFKTGIRFNCKECKDTRCNKCFIPMEFKALEKSLEIMRKAGFANKHAAQAAAAAEIMKEAKKVSDKDPNKDEKERRWNENRNITF